MVEGQSKVERFEAMIVQPDAADTVISRLGGGETLKEIADAHGVPYRRLVAWIAGSAELSARAMRAAGLAAIDLRLEGLDILDGSNPDDIQVDKERALYRERLSRDLNKPLFGTETKGGGVHVTINVPNLRGVDADSGGAVPAPVTVDVVPSSPTALPSPAIAETPEAEQL